MALKILDPRESPHYCSFRAAFELDESLDFEWYDSPDHKDLVDILILNHLEPQLNLVNYNYRVPVFMDIYHNFDDQIKVLEDRTNGREGKIYVTNARDFDIDNSRIVFNDFLFNRTKAYYLKFPFRSTTQKWYYTADQDYEIPKHNVNEKTKIFLAPNRISSYDRPLYGRRQIVNLLLSMTDLGHLGCRDRKNHLDLFGKSEVVPTVTKVSELIRENVVSTAKSGYIPPHNLYYQDTFISIYGETNEFGSSFAVTEKTFDPLLKGHFILPFANQYFLKNLKEQYGFKLPNFIDYSYDNIADTQLRSNAHINECRRLLTLSLDDWKQHWLDNQTILEYNKTVFYTRPYHTVDYTKFLL